MTPGLQRHDGGDRLPRHRHRCGYIAVVLAGDYVEAGDGGRLRASAGSVIVHGPFSAHRDDFGRSGAQVLNLPLATGLIEGAGAIADIDAVVRTAERDPAAAATLVAEAWRPMANRIDDWPDRLAAALATDDVADLAGYARGIGIAPASLSRGFALAYGVTPKRYRLEQRARRALGALPGWSGSLAMLAAETGFADQAHMGRTIAAMTGATPMSLRANSVQDRARQRR